MPLQSTFRSEGKGICLLSLDAGGTRGISQLKILAEVMHRLNFEVEENQKLLPCDVFDMIGGTGSGGFIAFLLVTVGLDVGQALEAFIKLSTNILAKPGVDAETRIAEVKAYIENLLEQYGVEVGMCLMDQNGRSKGCKLVVPISYKHHVGHACMLRNFDIRLEETLNLTIVEAMLATLASPPLFTPTSIFKDATTFQYTSADLTISNPTRKIISEAYRAFGDESRVACLLSLGYGHPGIIKAPETADFIARNQFLERLVTDSERVAQEIDWQMGHLGLYYRLSVHQELGEVNTGNPADHGSLLTHTAIYLSDRSISSKVDQCVDSLKSRDGLTSLEQLTHSGGQAILWLTLPPLARNFVTRKEPWQFIERVMLGTRSSADADEPRMLVVTGMGGCGKTELLLKFMPVHKDRFISVFFIDGSSVPQIRADTIRHVKSLGVAHSQKGFDDCLLFLGQSCPGGPRLILYDNVDDPDIDLAPLLPLGKSCVVMVTSRNRSLGELCPEGHLELDVMSMDEAVDLLLHRSGRSTTVTDQIREEMGAIARALGFLPIALTQACSYMFQTQCSPSQYLERLLNSRDKLLSQPIKHHRDMRYVSTYAAFDASFGLLALPCQHILRLLSCFHWNNFPLELVVLAAKHNFSGYQTKYIEHGDEYYTGKATLEAMFVHKGKWDIADLDEMIISLRNYSLITLISGVGTQLVQMHPVTHGWVNSSIPEQERAKYQAGALLLLALGARNEYTPSSQYLTSHVTHMSTLLGQLHANNAEAFAIILDHGGLFEAALKLRESVVAKFRSKRDKTNIAESIWPLALTYCSLGRYKDAEPLQREALKLKTKALGKRHRDAITASSNLARTYRYLGQLREAELQQEEALESMKEVLGERHRDTIIASNHLAYIYRDLGRLKEAEALMEEVLKLKKETLGERHPKTAMNTIDLANIYRLLGRVKEAEVLQEEALKLMNEVLGESHPDTILSSYQLALTYRDLGRLKEEALMEEVLKLRKEILGERHPDTIAACTGLALIYCDLGRLKEAQVLRENMLKLSKQILGVHHPETIRAFNNVADSYLLSGRLGDAEELQVETVRQAQEILGNEHPETALYMFTLAEIYVSLHKKSDAFSMLDAAELIFAEKVGKTHKDYLDCLELRAQAQGLPDAPLPVTTLDPSQNQPNVAPNPSTSTASHPPTRVRRLMAQLRGWVS